MYNVIICRKLQLYFQEELEVSKVLVFKCIFD